MIIPTLTEMLDATPEKYKSFVTTLAPSVLDLARLGLLDALAWLQRVITGDPIGAYKQLLLTLAEPDFNAAWDTFDDELDAGNDANAVRKKKFADASILALKALAVAISLMVGL